MIARSACGIIAAFMICADLHAQAPANLRTDLYGDPLPDDAIARLGTTRFKHDPARGSRLSKAVFSEDGKRIVSQVPNGTIRVWNAATGAEEAGPWSSNKLSWTAMAISPDGAQLAGSSFDANNSDTASEIALWNLVASKPLITFRTDSHYLSTLAFTETGTELLSTSWDSVTWWSCATGTANRSWKPFAKESQQLKDGGRKFKQFERCRFSPGAKYLALLVWWHYVGGDKDGEVEPDSFVVLDCVNMKECWRAKHSSYAVASFAFSSDSKTFVLSLKPEQVEMRYSADGGLLASLPSKATIPADVAISDLAISPDGASIAICVRSSEVILWNAKDTTKFRRFALPISHCSGDPSWPRAAFSVDSKKLLVGADADIQIYDLATLKELFTCEAHRGWVDYVAFSRDGKRLVTGSAQMNLYPRHLMTWDTSTWKSLESVSAHAPKWPNIGAAPPTHHVFAGREGDDRLNLYDYDNGRVITRVKLEQKLDASARGFFSPSGKTFVLGGKNEKGNEVERLFSAQTGQLLCELPGVLLWPQAWRFEPVRPIAFSADDKYAALVKRADSRICVFETSTGKLLYSFGQESKFFSDQVTSLAFSSDGRLLASGHHRQGLIRVWDLASGKQRLQLRVADSPEGFVHFAWSPDGRTLAVACSPVLADNATIKLWELATRRVRRKFTGHQGQIRALDFSPDGRLLASGSADTTVLIWNVWGH